MGVFYLLSCEENIYKLLQRKQRNLEYKIIHAVNQDKNYKKYKP